MRIALFLATLVLLVSIAACIQPIPTDPAPEPETTGLLGTYFSSTSGERVFERIDATPNRYWDRTGTEPLGVSPPDLFSVVWEGSLVIDTPGDYTFTTFGDDGVRLFIDGENIMPARSWSVWGSGEPIASRTHTSDIITLSGVHDIRIEFFQFDWNAQIGVNWTRPDGVSEPLPSSALRPSSVASEPPYGAPASLTDTARNPPSENTCSNNALDGDETDIDCGGSCAACGITQVCIDNSDCTSGLCESGTCVERTVTPPPSDTRTITYTADTTTDFPNPERGWLAHTSSTGGFNSYRDDAITVVWTTTYSSSGNLFRLDEFRYSNISRERLDALHAWFDTLRDAGLKAKVRFSYNGNPSPVGPDAPVESIVTHIEQLEEILVAHEDVIAMLDASFVGKWSEWHSSDFGITDNDAEGRAARSAINEALLDSLPQTRMIGHRYPALLREYYGDPGYIGSDEYFTGSDQSRLGWLNDCFLQGQSNVGTFNTWTQPQPETFERDRATFDNMGPYAVASAETCDTGGGINAYNMCDAAIAEMEEMNGPDLLNSAYWQGNYDHWKEEGCYDDISRRLGYRLVLESATIPEGASRGEAMSISLVMRNDGFGKVYNPRPIELVFDGPIERRVQLVDDARRDLPIGGDAPNNRAVLTYSFTVPSDLPMGTYALRLALPDASPSIANDARYAIRLANVGTWVSADGTNDLDANIVIS